MCFEIIPVKSPNIFSLIFTEITPGIAKKIIFLRFLQEFLQTFLWNSIRFFFQESYLEILPSITLRISQKGPQTLIKKFPIFWNL